MPKHTVMPLKKANLCCFQCAQHCQSISMSQHPWAGNEVESRGVVVFRGHNNNPSRVTREFSFVYPCFLISKIRYKMKGKKGTEMSKEQKIKCEGTAPQAPAHPPQEWGLARHCRSWKHGTRPAAPLGIITNSRLTALTRLSPHCTVRPAHSTSTLMISLLSQTWFWL